MSQKNRNIILLKALSDPSRYKIIKILISSEGTLCVNELSQKVKITPSAVSHQLSKLEDLRLVEPKRIGQTVCYSLKKNSSSEKVKNIIQLLE